MDLADAQAICKGKEVSAQAPTIQQTLVKTSPLPLPGSLRLPFLTCHHRSLTLVLSTQAVPSSPLRSESLVMTLGFPVQPKTCHFLVPRSSQSSRALSPSCPWKPCVHPSGAKRPPATTPLHQPASRQQQHSMQRKKQQGQQIARKVLLSQSRESGCHGTGYATVRWPLAAGP